MSVPSREELLFLPEAYLDIVGKFDNLQTRLVYPNPDFRSARHQLVRTSSSVASLIDSSSRTIAFDTLPAIGEAASTADMEHILTGNGLYGVLINAKHSLLIGTAALATGVALSSGSSDAARHGFELGARMIGQRARVNAHLLIGATLCSRTDLGFVGGQNLLELARRFYSSNRKNMNPLSEVPKSVGVNFEEISSRVHSEDNFDRSHVAGIDVGRRGLGLLGRLGNRLGAANAASKASKTVDPVTANEFVEELFDTYLGCPVLKMEDREALLVGSFAKKVQKYYETAGRSIVEIRNDPRTKYLGLLVSRLGGMDIPKTEGAYKKTAHDISREASKS